MKNVTSNANFNYVKLISEMISARQGPLERSETNARLIGRRPDVAQNAFDLVIYPPAAESLVNKVTQNSYLVDFPDFFKFLTVANGISVDVGKRRIMGLWPVKKEQKMHPHNYPSNLLVENDTNTEELKIGFYSEFDAFLHLDKAKKIELRSRNGIVLHEWNSLELWLSTEGVF